MNKSFYKLTISLVLIISALVIILILVVSSFTTIWLHTYKAFTKEKLVAQITVSEQFTDEDGFDTFNIVYRPVDDESALVRLLTNEGGSSGFEEKSEYMFLGDEFEVGGQVIKFNNWVTLLGFDTIYKVTKIEGDFTDVEQARNAPERSIEELNGGVDPQWKYLQENEENLDFLVDTVYGSSASKFILREEKIYRLYITEDGFILDELD